MKRFLTTVLASLALALLLLGATCKERENAPAVAITATLRGTVVGARGMPLARATVYLIPTTAVVKDPITAAGLRSGAAEAFDEPLEDALRSRGDRFASALSAGDGSFRFDRVESGRYYVYAEPPAGDAEHLPGGSWCRKAVDAAGLRGRTIEVVLSSSPGPGAIYVGMSTCLICHPSYAVEKSMAHRLGFTVPGKLGGLQSLAEHPELFDGLEHFLTSSSYSGGTPVYHYDYDSSRGFDKFKTSLSDPRPGGGILYAILWLWKNAANGRYQVTFENAANPADPNNFATREAKLMYGGAVYKRRLMIDWPGRRGLYPLLQFQHEGDEARYDRTRREYRDYHLDFYWNDAGTPAVPGDDLIRAPAAEQNMARNCLGCHATGYQQYTDPVTLEVLADTVEDAFGEYDLDGDGYLNDLNVGCETCHGAGSQHVADLTGRYIVSPEYLSPEREVMLCARCHDRQVGNGTIKNEIPLNAADQFAPPGISRHQFLAEYVTVKAPGTGDMWPDDLHSKSHHQQAADFFKARHYRNDRELLTCESCHDAHGGTGQPRALRADPEAPESLLCQRCHAAGVGSTAAHSFATVGFPHDPATTSCADCHMSRTAKTGAGRYGFLLGTPTGSAGDDDLTYFENDISSHVFDVPRTDNVGVLGVQPAKAMPIPYTQACGACHDPAGLPGPF